MPGNILSWVPALSSEAGESSDMNLDSTGLTGGDPLLSMLEMASAVITEWPVLARPSALVAFAAVVAASLGTIRADSCLLVMKSTN